MKKVISILLSAAMLLSLAACGAGSDSSANTTDGTYTGEGTGKGGKIQVELTLKNNEIADIVIGENNETPGYADAMEQMKQAMIASNQIEVDGVAGATFSSKGFQEAVKDAFNKSGAKESDLVKKDVASTSSDMADSYESDVVVVGAGGAGLSAAITAAENGAKVILIEKMNNVGGNTLISGGEMAAPGNWLQEKEGIKDDVETFYNDILKGGDNENDPALVRIVAENALNAAEWLRDDVKMEFEDNLLFFGGHSVKRSLVPKNATGVEMIQKLTAKAESLGVQIFTNTAAKHLVTENDKVVAVQAENNGKSITFHANNGVVLATGGFGYARGQ